MQVNSAGQSTHVSIVTELGREVCGDGVTRPCFKTSSGNVGSGNNRVIKWSQDQVGTYGSFSLDNVRVYTRYPA